jgi:hypothetical protein
LAEQFCWIRRLSLGHDCTIDLILDLVKNRTFLDGQKHTQQAQLRFRRPLPLSRLA